jgi:DNA polymerase-3 subunit epsilon
LPKSPPTRAQLTALAAGREKLALKYVCKHCQSVFEYKLRGRLCENCRAKKSAISTAQQYLNFNPLIIFDVETTGLDSEAEIISLTAVNGTGDILYKGQFKPAHPIDPGAAAIHGLTAATLAAAPFFVNEFPKMASFFNDAVVMAYNADFDLRLLAQTCERYGLTPPAPRKTGCIMKIHAEFAGNWSEYWGNYRWHRLADAAAQLGITLDNAHDSTADVIAALNVLKMIAGAEV